MDVGSRHNTINISSIPRCICTGFIKEDAEMIPLLLACIAEAFIHFNPDFLAKDEFDLLYWCRKNFKGFHSISDDGFLQDFKQVYECYQALQNVGKQENNIKINM